MTAAEEPVLLNCGGDTLIGVLHRGLAPRKQTAILFVVGGPQYRVGSHRQFVVMARAFATAGFSVLRFDHRGIGDSSGEFSSFTDLAIDIRCAMDSLCAAVPDAEGVVLFGLCDAASAVAMYGFGDARAKGLVLANPWVRSEAGEAQVHVERYYARRVLQRAFWAKLLRGELSVVKRLTEFAGNLRQAYGRHRAEPAEAGDFIGRMLAGLQSFGGRVLILLSERDLTADEFRNLCRRSPAWRAVTRRQTTTTVDIVGADHTFSDRPALDKAIGNSLAWLTNERLQ